MRLTGEHIHQWYEHFSIPILLKTLFSPWRQIVAVQNPNGGIQAIFGGAIDNVISRFVGFWVRISVMIAGLVVIIFVVLVNIVIFILWPLLPLAPFLLVGGGLLL